MILKGSFHRSLDFLGRIVKVSSGENGRLLIGISFERIVVDNVHKPGIVFIFSELGFYSARYDKSISNATARGAPDWEL